MARPTKNTPTKLPKSSKAASAAGQAKGRGAKWVTNSLNKLPEFKDNPVSEDTVYRAFKDMEAALEK